MRHANHASEWWVLLPILLPVLLTAVPAFVLTRTHPIHHPEEESVTEPVLTRIARRNSILENVTFPKTEACYDLHVAGLIGHVQLVGTDDHPMAQLLDIDYRPILYPISCADAGLQRDDEGWFGFTVDPPNHTADAEPAAVVELSAFDRERFANDDLLQRGE
jgi:hypothetical protein